MSGNNHPTSSCSCGGSTPNFDTTVINPSARNLLDPPEDWTTCPVMPDTPVDKTAAEVAGLFRDYGGRRYWFCCSGCGPRFDSDPDRYASVA